MSFSIPQNVPDFSASVREVENRLWAAKGKASDRELPLYKDKPYGIDYSHKRTKKKRKVLMLLAMAGAIFYLLYRFGNPDSEGSAGPGKNIKDYLPFLKSKPKVSWDERRDAVKTAFQRSWHGYEKYAWGKDVYKPISKTGANMGPKPLGWIIVDSLDTMKIMGLDKEFDRARNWVKNELNYDMDYNVNTFETTIRMLGGLLSTHFLTLDDLFLEKATDLANRIIGAFDSPTGIPYASVNLHSGVGIRSHTDMGASSTAEVATLQLEFKYLAKLTGETLYWEKAEQVIAALDNNHPEDGLVPIYVHPESGKYQESTIRLGSRGDSYYEYLIKQYLQTQSQEYVYKAMYSEAVEGIKKKMVAQSEPNKLTYIGEIIPKDPKLSPKMDHLVCFAGGMFALGATEGLPIDIARRRKWTTTQENDFRLGMELTRTCYEMYKQTKTGLAPEIVHFHDQPGTYSSDFYIKPHDAHNLQRPETVESLFILWRLTKNPIYREWGWEIFQSFEKYTALVGDAGYTSLDDVTSVSGNYRDNMESFWLSETLKYLYLLFDDDDHGLDLSQVVFSTEAHPFPTFSMGSVFKTGWERTEPGEERKIVNKQQSTEDVFIEAKRVAATTEYRVVANPTAAAAAAQKGEKKEAEEAKPAVLEKKEEKTDGSVAEKAAEAAQAAAAQVEAQVDADKIEN